MKAWLCIGAATGVAFALALPTGAERPRDTLDSAIIRLCVSYERWKVLAGPKIAEPDPAPNLTRRCLEGPP